MKTIRRTVKLEWMIRSQYPAEYMAEVFGVSPGDDPKFIDTLIRASHCGGILFLMEVSFVPKGYIDNMIRYLTRNGE